MRLIASMIVHNERGRYLLPCVEHLEQFCDTAVILDDASDDGTWEWLNEPGWPTWDYVDARRLRGGRMFEHEGRARQQLLEATFQQAPSHVLAVDADEFVSDGPALRQACEQNADVLSLLIEEVWNADERSLYVRQDGGWRAHPIPCCYRVPERRSGLWRIQDRQMACGREPLAVRQLAGRAAPSGVSLLHFGWANRGERHARYERYVEADGGRFHASSHLQSILAPDRRVRLSRREWPAALQPFKRAILERANTGVAA